MDHQFSKKYKRYFASRCSDDLTVYAQEQIKKFKRTNKVNNTTYSQQQLQENVNAQQLQENLNLEQLQENLNLEQLQENLNLEQLQENLNLEQLQLEIENVEGSEEYDANTTQPLDENLIVQPLEKNANNDLFELESLENSHTDDESRCPKESVSCDETINAIHPSQRAYLSDSDELTETKDKFPYDFFESENEDMDINNIASSKKINNLQDLLESEGFMEVIKTTVNISPGELLIMILRFCTSNHLPHTAMSNLLSLVNTIFVEPVLPQSRYMLDKLFNPKDELEFYAVCPTCSGFLGKVEYLDYNAPCKICKAKMDLSKPSCENLFLMINPSNALKEILHAHENYYDYVVSERQHEQKHIKDIYDGKMYRKFVSSLPDEDKCRYATTVFNTDGAPVFKSSQYSIWPIYLMVNEIPPQDRFNNLITVGLWFNKKKPNMTVFLSSFVNVMNDLATSGIRCKVKEEERNIKVYTLVCCVDTTARAPIQGIKQFNGFESCNWCLHPGEWIGSMKYPILCYVVNDRNQETTEFYMMQSVTNDNYIPVHGIKHVSALINLKSFHIIDSFVPDYMHCCLSGVGKQITNYLVKPNDIDFFQSLIMKIKFPHQVTRLTRPLNDKNYWKAREWENWILYISTPLLSLKLEKKFMDYWTLFVESLHILLRTDITYDELDKADKMLHTFVFKTEKYFTKSAMTYNIHQMLHLAKSVLNWGPLWAHSAFAFEAGNHQILKSIKCARGVILQIIRYININRSTLILEKSIFPDMSEAARAYCNRIMTLKVKKCVKVLDKTYFGKGVAIEEDLMTQCQVSSTSKVYERMVKNGCLYASCLRKKNRSDNSVAQLRDGRFIRLRKFIVDLDQRQEFTMCHIIRTSIHNISCNYKKLHEIISVDYKEMVIVPTNEIVTICVLIETRKKNYVCPLPNLFFY